MPKEDTQFTSENQPDRKPRGKGRKSLMLDAIRKVCKTEQEFLQQVVILGLGDGKELPANPTLLTLVLNRIEPPLKATSPMVNFEFNEKAKPHEQAAQTLKAVSEGNLSPDIGNMFVQSIKAMIDIEEYTDLKERIEEIEKSLGIVSE
ncbi:MAG: hypothetical protein GY787_06325 [Alteromonadales bacterium]|nr:hypothetical protein [Alteromonadales bacterium]